MINDFKFLVIANFVHFIFFYSFLVKNLLIFSTYLHELILYIMHLILQTVFKVTNFDNVHFI